MNQKNAKGKHGSFETYHENGKLRCKANFLNGKAHGLWELYYEDGQVYYKGIFKNNQKIGLWLDSNLYGKILKRFYL